MKNSIIKRDVIMEVLIYVCWLIVMVLFIDMVFARLFCYEAIGFVTFGTIVSVISLLFIKVKNDRNATEVNIIPVYVTGVYYASILIGNTLFIIGMEPLFIWLVAYNLTALIIFTGFRVITKDYSDNVEKTTVKLQEKMQRIEIIKNLISILLGDATDTEIKKKLLKLKESMDYSSNLSQPGTEQYDDELYRLLVQIQNMMGESKEKDALLKMIDEANVIWKKRVSFVSSMK